MYAAQPLTGLLIEHTLTHVHVHLLMCVVCVCIYVHVPSMLMYVGITFSNMYILTYSIPEGMAQKLKTLWF